MKKRGVLLLLFLYCLTLPVWGQELTSIGLAHLEADFALPKIVDSQVKVKMRRALAKNGLSNSVAPCLALVPELLILDESMSYGTPSYTEVEYELVFSLRGIYSNNAFDSYTYPVKGKGRNKLNAIAKGMKKVRLNTPEFSSFLQNAQKKAVAYFEKNLNVIVAKANTAINVKKYDKALFILSEVPESIPSFTTKVLPLLEKAYQMHTKYNSEATLLKAKALWAANKSDAVAIEVAELLATIPSDSPVYSQVAPLVASLEAHSTDKEKFNRMIRVKILDQAHDEEKARIEAARAVGIAYGKNSGSKIILWR